MCSDIWFLPKSKVQTGSHYYTPCCTFTHKCHCASAGPCSPVAEPERPNMRQRFLRRSPPPPFADPRFLLHHALWAVTPSLHPDHRSHTRAAFHPRSCWEDVSVWLKALWEISTTRPSGGHEEGTRTSKGASERGLRPSLFDQKAAWRLQDKLGTN